jgi:putative endonuclease
MANTNQRVGRFGEWLAAEHLVDLGMRLVDRNWRCRFGEIDIIAWDGADTIVFCEVKTRSGTGYGPPAAAVGRAKQLRLRKLAAEWLRTTGHRARNIRFDVVSVLPGQRGAPRVEHLRNAF